MQHIWWVGSMYRYTLSQGVQAGSVLAVAYAYHNISVRTALPTRCMCAACHLSSTVQSGIGPRRVLLSKVPDATEGERSSRFQQRAAFRWGPRWRTRSWQTSLPETLSDLAHLFFKLQTNSCISHRSDRSQSIMLSKLDVEVPLLKCQPVLTPFNYIPFGTKSHELLSFFIYNTEVRNSM